jgi:hypothetical protein
MGWGRPGHMPIKHVRDLRRLHPILNAQRVECVWREYRNLLGIAESLRLGPLRSDQSWDMFRRLPRVRLCSSCSNVGAWQSATFPTAVAALRPAVEPNQS